MYARAKIGGFLHLSIGEEATIVGSARALRDEDYLVSTYRSHGDALARGHLPRAGDGRAVRQARRLLQRPRRLDAHVRRRAPLHGRLRDRRRQPADRGRHRARLRPARLRGGDPVHVRRRRLQPGHVRRDPEPRRPVASAGRVHGRQQPVRHGHLARAVTPPSPTCNARASRSACRACAATAWTSSTPIGSSPRRWSECARSADHC